MGRDDEWFYDIKKSHTNDEHEMYMKEMHVATLIISTILHIINGCFRRDDENAIVLFVINIVSMYRRNQ